MIISPFLCNHLRRKPFLPSFRQPPLHLYVSLLPICRNYNIIFIQIAKCFFQIVKCIFQIGKYTDPPSSLTAEKEALFFPASAKPPLHLYLSLLPICLITKFICS